MPETLAVGATTAPRTPVAPRRNRRRRRERVEWAVRSVVLWVVATIFILPLAWMISSSLKRDLDVFSLPLQWIPDPAMWSNYLDIWAGDGLLGRAFINSTLVIVGRLIGELLVVSLAGYAFGRLVFKGRDAIFLVFLATSIVPAQLLLIPRFMFFRQIGLYDSLWALILPSLASVFGTFLMRQHFASAPPELGEAARIDGANEWQIFSRIYLRLAMPIMAALSILIFEASWNDYESPLIMLASKTNFTVPLALARLTTDDSGLRAGLAMAGSAVSIVPMVVVFVIFQRQFLTSMSRVGLR